MNDCPCGSGRAYSGCCGPLIEGKRAAETAESLMRSRYSAFVKGEIGWLEESLHPDHRAEHDTDAARSWAEKSEWTGLDVRQVTGGGAGDDEGTVEFIASYRHKDMPYAHHETGRFTRHKGRWYYVDGKMATPGTQRNEGPKIGRNDPCPCGSGKKYKKCCG